MLQLDKTCKGGHKWAWISNGTSSEPPDECTCYCGTWQWKDYKKAREEFRKDQQ